MRMGEKLSACCIGFVILVLQISAFASTKKLVSPGPMPAEILTAKRVFIANAGWDEPYFTNTPITGRTEARL